MNEEARIKVLSMTLMSDVLFNAFMNDNNEGMEYVLRVIMDKDDLHVLRVEVQHSVPNPYVIFITENDVLGGDLPIYHIDRCI